MVKSGTISDYSLTHFWTLGPPDTSGTVEDRNFKFVTETVTKAVSTNEKNAILGQKGS